MKRLMLLAAGLAGIACAIVWLYRQTGLGEVIAVMNEQMRGEI